MTSAMFRRCLTVALVAVVALAPAAPAQAGGGEKSRFAGSYASGDVLITISDGGLIKGSTSTGNFYKVTLNGRVNDDGSYSYTMSVTYEDQERRGPGPKYLKETYEYAGTLAFDADGNIVGTKDTGGSFVWLRN